MYFRKPISLVFFILLAALVSCTSKNESLTDYVDPFIGTGGHGHTFPGATLPFGMVQLSPDTRLTGWDGCSGYHYSDSIIYGFSHTHLSGTGVADYCDILFMPTVGKPMFTSGYIDEDHKTNKGYGSIFKKDTETASPNYYSVKLEDYGITAELTSSLRCGMHRYTFPASKKANIIIDLTHRDEVLASDIEILSDNEIQGSRISKSWAQEQHIYFYAKFSKPFADFGILKNDSLLPHRQSAEGKNIKSFLQFETDEGEQITAAVGISAVSKEGAKQNYIAEVADKSFETLKTDGEKVWEKELDRIHVEGGSEEDMRVFYTALYHSMTAPNLFMDTDRRYRGTDLQIHTAENHTNYTVFSLWDTYRATHPLFTIIHQKRSNDFIKTFLHQYKHGGRLPMWELAGNYTGCMIGYHAIPVISDALMKGIDDYDKDLALEAMIHSASENHLGLEEYRRFGYIPANYEHESVSKTLEYAYDDWCIAQAAKHLNRKNAYMTYLQRAQYYKNLFDPETGFMTAKRDARWIKPFDPAEVNYNFTEANSWQYSFYVPQDISGLADLLGGKAELEKKLDELFSVSSETTGRGQVDITGLIGQYAHGNEPSHHMAYLYNFTGSPHKTQEMVNRICNEMYSDRPDGLIGNEDCGQMSACYVFSAMGFYPVTPGNNRYIIGTPRFDKVSINLENGKQFTVKAKGNDPDKPYIASAELNGKPYSKSYITHSDIMNGGTLVFHMSDRPSETWGKNPEDRPKTSINNQLITPVPFLNADNTVFEDSLQVTLGSVDPNSAIYYTFGDENPTEKSNLYTNAITLEKSVRLRFIAVNNNGQSQVMETEFTKIPSGRSIRLNTEYAPQYAAGGDKALIDGIKGINDFRLGDWQGYQKVDVNAIIDLGSLTEINALSIRFLQDINAWIFMPEQVEFYISDNDKTYIPVGTVKNTVAQDDWDVQIKDFKINVYPKKTRYIKIIGRNIGICPEEHKAAGYKAWIFADEITIK